MRIGFVAPMKAPDHPVPSGDRQMARGLIAALTLAGHDVAVLSTVRSFMATPDANRAAVVAQAAASEVERIAAAGGEPPEAVLAYHLHYKAPDLVGLPLARRWAVPYLTAEASYARKRDNGPWHERQAQVAAAVRHAAVNLCFTANDRAGLDGLAAPESLVDLPPFIDATGFAPPTARFTSGHDIVTVAMMRAGDKLASYSFLADALGRLTALPWRLTIVGDGPERPAVERLFAAFAPGRVRLTGSLSSADVAHVLRQADLFVWPGFNEAFGLCYLEAQACGLPAVAVRGEGTPSVIRHGATGLLTPPDPMAYASAIASLLSAPATQAAYGDAAIRFVHEERSLPGAAARLGAALKLACRRHRDMRHV